MDAIIALIQKLPGTADMSAQALHVTGASVMAVLMFTPILCVTFFGLASAIIVKNDILGYKK